MKLFTNAQTAELLANGAVSARGENHDPKPVVKLFTPVSNATWLLTELDPADPDVAFGLCDLGLGCPELAMYGSRSCSVCAVVGSSGGA
jgi:hypothetical protein